MSILYTIDLYSNQVWFDMLITSGIDCPPDYHWSLEAFGGPLCLVDLMEWSCGIKPEVSPTRRFPIDNSRPSTRSHWIPYPSRFSWWPGQRRVCSLVTKVCWPRVVNVWPLVCLQSKWFKMYVSQNGTCFSSRSVGGRASSCAGHCFVGTLLHSGKNPPKKIATSKCYF